MSGYAAHEVALWKAATELADRGIRIAMVRLGWDDGTGKKVQLTHPPAGWQLADPFPSTQVKAAMDSGCNAYLWRLPDDWYAVDADTTELREQYTAVLGAPDVVTPRGAHWVVDAPAAGQERLDTGMRALYGPGSYYPAAGELRIYRGVVPAGPRHLPAELVRQARTYEQHPQGAPKVYLRADAQRYAQRFYDEFSEARPGGLHNAMKRCFPDIARWVRANSTGWEATAEHLHQLIEQHEQAGFGDGEWSSAEGLIHRALRLAAEEPWVFDTGGTLDSRFDPALHLPSSTPFGVTSGNAPPNSIPDRSHFGAPFVPPSGPELVLRRGSDTTERVARWLWKAPEGGRIPLHTVTICAGRGGVGKSPFTLWAAAQLSRGMLRGAHEGLPAETVIYSREDSWETVIVPRLRAAGADLSMIRFIEAAAGPDGMHVPFNWQRDIPALEQITKDPAVGLLIVDPLLAVLASGKNSNADNDVSDAVSRILALAERTETTVLGLAHVGKDSSRSVDTLLRGSSAWRDTARAVLLFGEDKRTGERLMEQNKNNYGRTDLPTMSFRMVSVVREDPAGGPLLDDSGDEVSDPVFELLGVSETSFADAMASTEHTAKAKSGEPDEEFEWLADLLEEGPQTTVVVQNTATARGLKWETFRKKAKTTGHFTSRKIGQFFDAVWCWELTEQGCRAYEKPRLTMRAQPPAAE